MYPPRVKAGVFLLEGLNALATSYYFLYLFFYMQGVHGFGNRENLLLAALNGFIYAVSSVFGGRFGQRRGYFAALRVGYVIMTACVAAAWFNDRGLGHVLLAAACCFGMCFTWPALEALVSEGEPPARLQRMVGLYNLVWAACGAVAYFTGGALIERFGDRSIFAVPVGLNVVQLALTLHLERLAARPPAGSGRAPAAPSVTGLNPRPIARTRAFLRLAWLANPLSYIATSSVIPVMPGLAKQFELSPKFAGFFCSIWFIARAASFVVCWCWDGWHYRLRWLLAAYVLMVLSFAAILLAPGLPLLIAAQIAFGGGVGLIYYSSLYYSMDVGEKKGEHGGIHEAAIGAGNCLGPALSAAALFVAPAQPAGATWAVSGVLLLGLLALVQLRWRPRRTAA
jgi:MFS family permease